MSERLHPFRMLTCFNLSPTATIDQFARALDVFTTQMQRKNLVLNCEPLGQRQRHPVMDTDKERDHEYFFILTFKSRDQCDAAVRYMMSQPVNKDEYHASLLRYVEDPVFICWEDLSPAT